VLAQSIVCTVYKFDSSLSLESGLTKNIKARKMAWIMLVNHCDFFKYKEAIAYSSTPTMFQDICFLQIPTFRRGIMRLNDQVYDEIFCTNSLEL